MKSLTNIVARMPQIMPQVTDLVWGNFAERLRAVDALAATGDRRVLPVLCERIGDPSQEVVVRIRAGIDLVDPITAVQVAREMTCNGGQDHLRVATSYFLRHAPWELPEPAPNPQATIASLRGMRNIAQLRRALIARHPGIRRAAARRLAAVADPMTLMDLDVHLQGKLRIPPDGILGVFVRVLPIFAYERVEAASVTWSEESCTLLAALARVGGRGTWMLLTLLSRGGAGPAEEELVRHRPRELLQRCGEWLLAGDQKRSERAVSILSNLIGAHAPTSRFLQNEALAMLLAALERAQPGAKAMALQLLTDSADPASLSCDAVKFLRHKDARVRRGALALLAAQGRVDQVEVVRRMFENNHERGKVRAQALLTLARLDPAGRLERARVAISDERYQVVEAGLDSLDGLTVPISLCEVGCQVIGRSPGDGWRMLLEWLLDRFPEQSTTNPHERPAVGGTRGAGPRRGGALRVRARGAVMGGLRRVTTAEGSGGWMEDGGDVDSEPVGSRCLLGGTGVGRGGVERRPGAPGVAASHAGRGARPLACPLELRGATLRGPAAPSRRGPLRSPRERGLRRHVGGRPVRGHEQTRRPHRVRGRGRASHLLRPPGWVGAGVARGPARASRDAARPCGRQRERAGNALPPALCRTPDSKVGEASGSGAALGDGVAPGAERCGDAAMMRRMGVCKSDQRGKAHAG